MAMIVEIVRWVPVAEGLPDEGTDVMVWIEAAGESWVCDACLWDGYWFRTGHNGPLPSVMRVTHWARVNGPAPSSNQSGGAGKMRAA